MIKSNDQMNEPIITRVIIADHHAVARLGVRRLLDRNSMQMVGEAGTVEELLHVVEANEADCVVLDARLDQADAAITLTELRKRRPKLPVVVYSTSDNPSYVAGALMHGAAGYVTKSEPANSLVDAVRTAVGGGQYWPEDKKRRRIGSLSPLPLQSDVTMPLTRRETDVLTQLAQGKSNQEISEALHIGYETVKEHMKHILRKISVSDRTQAAVWAVRNKIIQ